MITFSRYTQTFRGCLAMTKVHRFPALYYKGVSIRNEALFPLPENKVLYLVATCPWRDFAVTKQPCFIVMMTKAVLAYCHDDKECSVTLQ